MVPVPIRVVIADDEELMRCGLRALLTSEPGIEVVGDAADGHQALAATHSLNPHVVTLDLSMRNLDGFEALTRIRRDAPDTRVLVVSGHDETRVVVRALALGAHGYLLKAASSVELRRAVRIVASGERFIDPRIPVRTVEQLAEGADSKNSVVALTDRQRDVLQLIAEGKSTKEVAATLGLSVKTVEAHRAQLMQRLALRDTAALVKYALSIGIVSDKPKL